MKIRIIKVKGDWNESVTGKGYFLLRLMPELEKLGCKIITDPSTKCDIDLGIGKWRYEPDNCRKRVLRLGAVNIPAKGSGRKENAHKIKWLKRADAVIYQTRFSKKICDQFLGIPMKKLTTVIFNGAVAHKDVDQMSKPFLLAATRIWLQQKRLKQIVEAYAKSRRETLTPLLPLHIVGEAKKKPFCFGVKYVGSMSNDKLIDYMKGASALIHAVYLDACPNVVCEAQAMGIPVICTDQGGAKEIVKSGYIVKDKPYKYKPINLSKPPEFDQKAMVDAINRYSLGPSCKPNPDVEISNIAKQYLAFFEEVLG